MKRWSASILCVFTLFISPVHSAPFTNSSDLDLNEITAEHADYYYTLFLERFLDELDRPERKSTEYQKRKAIFLENVNYAREYNSARSVAGQSNTINVNSLFDTSFEDYRSNRLGRKILTAEEKGALSSGFAKIMMPAPFKGTGMALKKSIDWRDKGVVTGVKNQKNCGSCWVFGTIGAVESFYKLQGYPLVSLSEQFIGSCNGVRPMCQGGEFPVVLHYMVQNNYTVCTEDSCPYTSGTGVDMGCTGQLMNDCKKVYLPQTMKARTIDSGNDKALMEALQKGPVAVAINASLRSFMLYKEGVYDDRECLVNRADSLDHEVLVVGYGETEDNIPYWIIKNSWGTKWGEDGYMRMRRGKTGAMGDEYNDMCGISLDANQPVSGEKKKDHIPY